MAKNTKKTKKEEIKIESEVINNDSHIENTQENTFEMTVSDGEILEATTIDSINNFSDDTSEDCVVESVIEDKDNKDESVTQESVSGFSLSSGDDENIRTKYVDSSDENGEYILQVNGGDVHMLINNGIDSVTTNFTVGTEIEAKEEEKEEVKPQPSKKIIVSDIDFYWSGIQY